jgi:hypothetical protein
MKYLRLTAPLLALALPAAVQGQFNSARNDGKMTITSYTRSDDAVSFPHTITDWPVTSIGDHAFSFCSPTSATVSNSFTNIAFDVFLSCRLNPAEKRFSLERCSVHYLSANEKQRSIRLSALKTPSKDSADAAHSAEFRLNMRHLTTTLP